MPTDARMDLRRGFPIEEPAVVVPWGIREDQLRDLVGDEAANVVTRGYVTATGVVLGGLRLRIGFHFSPGLRGGLREVELFRVFPKDLHESFEEFQRHLELSLGPASGTAPAGDGFTRYEWRIGRVHVSHVVMDRYGPEEHVRFRR